MTTNNPSTNSLNPSEAKLINSVLHDAWWDSKRGAEELVKNGVSFAAAKHLCLEVIAGNFGKDMGSGYGPLLPSIYRHISCLAEDRDLYERAEDYLISATPDEERSSLRIKTAIYLVGESNSPDKERVLNVALRKFNWSAQYQAAEYLADMVEGGRALEIIKDLSQGSFYHVPEKLIARVLDKGTAAVKDDLFEWALVESETYHSADQATTFRGLSRLVHVPKYRKELRECLRRSTRSSFVLHAEDPLHDFVYFPLLAGWSDDQLEEGQLLPARLTPAISSFYKSGFRFGPFAEDDSFIYARLPSGWSTKTIGRTIFYLNSNHVPEARVQLHKNDEERFFIVEFADYPLYCRDIGAPSKETFEQLPKGTKLITVDNSNEEPNLIAAAVYLKKKDRCEYAHVDLSASPPTYRIGREAPQVIEPRDWNSKVIVRTVTKEEGEKINSRENELIRILIRWIDEAERGDEGDPGDIPALIQKISYSIDLSDRKRAKSVRDEEDEKRREEEERHRRLLEEQRTIELWFHFASLIVIREQEMSCHYRQELSM
jgi:hypothetical protein